MTGAVHYYAVTIACRISSTLGRLSALLVLAAWPAAAQEKQISVEEILSRVQAEKASYEASLPDCICDESLSSQKLTRGHVERQATAEASFRVERKRQHDEGKSPFKETRELRTLNGKPSSAKEFKGPLTLPNGVDDAFEIFAVDNVRCYTYQLEAPPDSSKAGSVLRVTFAAKPNVKELGGVCGENREGETGDMSIDSESFSVTRFQTRSPNLGLKNKVFTYSVDLTKAVIGGKEYWMPSLVQAEMLDTAEPVRYVYTARYTNYRKFDADSKVNYENR